MDDLDNPDNQLQIQRILRRKPFLRAVYVFFYSQLLRRCNTEGPIVELGSGAGFFRRLCSQAIATDILPYQGLDLCFSGTHLPFQSSSIGSFAMVDVFHHVPDPKAFLSEMSRCLQPSGRIVMVEPANTLFSRLVYTRFHHEDFDPGGGWTLPPGGPLSTANMALPWIVFCRDRERFYQECPNLELLEIKLFAPFQYLISGGLTLRQLLPGRSWPLVNALENWLTPLFPWLALFMVVTIRRREN